jgi:CheY-like chemotaxis protein
VESPDPASPAPARVLLVDDDRAVRETTTDLLMILGFDVVAAVNGEDAIQQLGRHAFDIIVTDIVMPKKDGYALLAAVRSNRATRGIPIVMLSAKADKPDIRKGITEGADDYLTKPFDSTELVATIKAQIKKRATREQDAENLRVSIAQLLPPELRPPLSESLVGFVDILADMASGEKSISDADIQRACERIGQSGQPFHRLVERVSFWAELCRPAEQILSGNAASPARGWVETATSTCREAATGRDRAHDLRIDLEPAAIAIPTPLLLELFSILAECGLEFSPATRASDSVWRSPIGWGWSSASLLRSSKATPPPAFRSCSNSPPTTPRPELPPGEPCLRSPFSPGFPARSSRRSSSRSAWSWRRWRTTTAQGSSSVTRSCWAAPSTGRCCPPSGRAKPRSCCSPTSVPSGSSGATPTPQD